MSSLLRIANRFESVEDTVREHVRKIEKIAKPQQDLEGSITRMSDTLTGLEAMMDECERLGY